MRTNFRTFLSTLTVAVLATVANPFTSTASAQIAKKGTAPAIVASFPSSVQAGAPNIDIELKATGGTAPYVFTTSDKCGKVSCINENAGKYTYALGYAEDFKPGVDTVHIHLKDAAGKEVDGEYKITVTEKPGANVVEAIKGITIPAPIDTRSTLDTMNGYLAKIEEHTNPKQEKAKPFDYSFGIFILLAVFFLRGMIRGIRNAYVHKSFWSFFTALVLCAVIFAGIPAHAATYSVTSVTPDSMKIGDAGLVKACGTGLDTLTDAKFDGLTYSKLEFDKGCLEFTFDATATTKAGEHKLMVQEKTGAAFGDTGKSLKIVDSSAAPTPTAPPTPTPAPAGSM